MMCNQVTTGHYLKTNPAGTVCEEFDSKLNTGKVYELYFK
jgi:hypothetical protein